MNARYRNLGIALCLPLCFALHEGCSESSPPVAVSPQEDAFLSYWQCADSLAKGLLEIQSHDELIEPCGAIDPPDQSAERSMKDVFDEFHNTLLVYIYI